MRAYTLHTLVIVSLILGVLSMGYFEELEQGYTGAPPETACASCHTESATGMVGGVSLEGLPAYVIAGQTIPLTVNVYTDNSLAKTAGFQMTLLNEDGISQGTFEEYDPNVGIMQFGNRQYVQHEPAFEFNDDLGIFSALFDFEWTSPTVSDLTIVNGYMSAVLGNGNTLGSTGGHLGDSVFTMAQTVTVVPQLTAEIVILTPVLCNGDESGALEVNASGGLAPLDIQWSTGETTQEIQGLGAGNYTVTLSDALGQQVILSQELFEPEAVIIELIDVQPQTQGTGGAIIIELMGGILPYDFFWTGPNDYHSTIQNPFNLVAGTYNLTVTDAGGCETYFMAEVDFVSSTHDVAERNRLLLLSPNPASTSLRISFPPHSGEDWHLKFIDATGRIISEQQINGITTDHTITIPEEWLEGMYLLVAKSMQTGINYTQRWVKVAE